MIEFAESCQLLRLVDDTGAELVRGDGSVQMSATGKLAIIIRVAGQTMASYSSFTQIDKCHVEGRTDAGWTLTADLAQVAGTSFDMGAGIVELSLEVIGECAIVAVPRPATWSRRVLTFNNASVRGLAANFHLEAYDWSVNADTNVPQGWNGPYPCQVVVATTPGCGAWDAAAQRTRLARLLSLYMRTPVVLVREEVYDGEDRVCIGLHHASRHDDADRGVGDRDTGTVANFLHQTMAGYALHADNYNLPVVLDYTWRIYAEQTLEIKLALASVLLESFKFHWALNLGPLENPPIQTALTPHGTVRTFYDQLNVHGNPVPIHFADLLNRATTAAGSPNFDATFIAERNCIFHTGLTSWSQLGVGAVYPFLQQLVRDLLDQIDSLLLRLLGYTGPVHRWWDRTAFNV